MAGENLNPDPDENKGEGEPKDEVQGLKSALADERRKRQDSDARAAQLEGQVQGLTVVKTEPQSDSPKELSAAQLRQAVDEGKMTEDEAVAINTRQIEKRVTAKVTEEVETTFARKNLGERVSVEIGRYKDVIPDLTDQSSAAFQKVRTEYEWLVSHGSTSNDPQTELMAVRAAFGDIDQLAKIKSGERETHQETGGNSEPGGQPDRSDGAPKDMPADTRRYYQDQISQGVVADWKAAKDEWSYKPKHMPRAKVA